MTDQETHKIIRSRSLTFRFLLYYYEPILSLSNECEMRTFAEKRVIVRLCRKYSGLKSGHIYKIWHTILESFDKNFDDLCYFAINHFDYINNRLKI